ncbi:MAG TPA: class I SAM-dependent methyltransferase [Rhizomicrobium sp.]|jgi:SAM-dependent methyltransferase
MSDPAQTFDPRRFQTTVPYYSRYRLGYPELLIRRVIERLDLRPGDPVMDLGCGPGLVAIPFARAGMKVMGIDPEPAMLEAAKAAAREAGVSLDLRQGSSFDLPKDIGPFELVTMGRSFHWMDREATVKSLDGLVTPDGAVVLMHDLHTKTAENRWRRMLHELGNDYGRDESFHVEARQSPDFQAHESILLNSAFSHVESIGVFVRRELTADDIVGLAFSLSTSSRQKLGDRAGEFEERLRAMLAELRPDGRFEEIAEMTAVIATRP